jgi:hypothetical protein
MLRDMLCDRHAAKLETTTFKAPPELTAPNINKGLSQWLPLCRYHFVGVLVPGRSHMQVVG